MPSPPRAPAASTPLLPAGSKPPPAPRASSSIVLLAAAEVAHVASDVESLTGRYPTLVALVACVSYLFLGVIGFHFCLGLTWTSAFYFAVTTSLTVGYGDIDAWSARSVEPAHLQNSTNASDWDYSPNGGAMVFTIFYIIGGTIVLGARPTDGPRTCNL